MKELVKENLVRVLLLASFLAGFAVGFIGTSFFVYGFVGFSLRVCFKVFLLGHFWAFLRAF